MRLCVGGRERENELKRERARLGFSFYWSLQRGPRISRAHSSLVNLKHRSGNFKCRKSRKKIKGPKWFVIEIDQDL